ncbi:hypothetical protein QTQ03_16850 [Micromonospora sp. WMMA1363]|uniref:hypothetical protein n=1 Tax=Micromonospora sp. WMMA1363 TaxID=3053985 RepID=UPI00259CAFB0|nr:hypothetical protein [Micromonospora sp. WMMA1363]MDM4721186.1 hypothetical protein [Micromonospora sp. WMMA1363]
MRKRGLALASAMTVFGLALPGATTVDSSAGRALPIPVGPRGIALQPFTGQPAAAHPIDAPEAPRHPFMADNGSSNIHGDAYQTDTYRRPGPTGRDLTVRSRLQGGMCLSVTFDSRGRIVTVCITPGQAPRLLLLDPGTLDAIAALRLPGTTSTSPTEISGGVYFYLDNHDRAIIPTDAGDILVVAVQGDRLVPRRSYDLTPAIGTSDIVSALPDWSGRLWFATKDGTVGTLDMTSGRVETHGIDGEQIANSIAVDESGGVFVASDHALYRFDAAPDGRPEVTWRTPYDRGSRQKPGQLSQGSGTTPTLIGPASGPDGGYVAITDNADPAMRVLVLARGKAGPTRVCAQPVFPARTGATENSLVAVGGDLIVENNYGYRGDFRTLLKGLAGARLADTAPGLTRIHVDYSGRRCSVAWSNTTERIPSVVSKVSLANGLLYTYTHPSADELAFRPGGRLLGCPDAWYLTAIDVRTGERVWRRLAGAGPLVSNHYAPVSLGPDGAAYVGSVGGLIRIADG